MTLSSKNGTAMMFMILAVLFLSADRILKNAAVNAGENCFDIAGHIFRFCFARNYNIAFSIPLGGTLLTALVAAIICALVYYTAKTWRKENSSAVHIGCLLLIIAGSLSNLFDRIFYGYVIDYLDLKYFTVFNIADMMIVGGVITIIKSSLNKKI